MKKFFGLFILSLPLFLLSCGRNSNFYNNHNLKNNDNAAVIDAFIYNRLADNTYEITGIDSSYLNLKEYRVYKTIGNKTITKIAKNAFASASMIETVMFTNNLVYIDPDAFSGTIPSIFYTGSKSEWDILDYSKKANPVSYYSYDEGFINLWNDNLPPSKSVCEISENTYRQILYPQYVALSIDDRTSADAYVFQEEGSVKFTIKDGMRQLSSLYNKPTPTPSRNLDQDSTLMLVIAISIIGMTAICVFYSLKDNEIIS